MTTTRCYRHTRWLAACPDCTAWHLARLLPHRAATAAAPHPAHAAAA